MGARVDLVKFGSSLRANPLDNDVISGRLVEAVVVRVVCDPITVDLRRRRSGRDTCARNFSWMGFSTLEKSPEGWGEGVYRKRSRNINHGRQNGAQTPPSCSDWYI